MTSLARRHRERMAGKHIAVTAANSSPVAGAEATGGVIPASGSPTGNSGGIDHTLARIRAQMQSDLQRLHTIQSVQRKIEAKRKMLPAYRNFVDGILDGAKYGHAVQDEILAVVMVWSIDTGDYAHALLLAEHVIKNNLPMPQRYARTAATIVAEEIADAALRGLARGDGFDIDTLQHVQKLTAGSDMPDQVRAKVSKAIGFEYMRRAKSADTQDVSYTLLEKARVACLEAQEFDDRCGVKKSLEKIARAMRAYETDTGTAG